MTGGHPVLIRRICSLGHLRRQVIHVLFVFLSFKWTAMQCRTCVATSQQRFICVFIFLLDGHLFV